MICGTKLTNQTNSNGSNNSAIYCSPPGSNSPGSTIPLPPGTGCTGKERIYKYTATVSGPVEVNVTNIDANENFASFFGYRRDELIGKSASALRLWCSEEDRTAALRRLQHKDPDNSEIQMRHRSGAVKDILANGDLLALNGEEYLISAFVDITQRKEAEQPMFPSGVPAIIRTN